MKNFRKLIIMFFISALLTSVFSSYGKSPDKAVLAVEQNAPYDVIIVPGVPYLDETMSRVLMGRIYWSHYLYENGYVKNIIYSGSAVYTPYIESEIMAMYGEAMGIPKSNIYTETEAEHSVENVYYSYKLAKKLGFKKIALATDPFQSRMVKGPSKRMDIHIDYIPFSFNILETMEINDYDIPAEDAYVKDFVSLEERENFFQRFRGTLGKKIVFEN